MTYQVLARKWRPQDFSSVVGQQPIVTALENALREGRIAQAYLFSGIRGVGKTSVARILAKALNCAQGPTAEPCNECDSCREIAAGTNLLDVIEHDAATYSKVEQVRELTDSLKYGPARDRYKVIILDEIHRLSRQAFDALLKIVEEPPPHLVFIFATTEVEAVPATILSRCQEFRFRRVPFEELAQHLERLAEAEQIEVSPTALRLIARAGEGSVRDSVALLDQLATFGSGKIADADAGRILGGVDYPLFRRILGAILEGRSPEIGDLIAEIEEQGWDPRYVFAEFLDYCRTALHLSLGAAAAGLELPQEEIEGLKPLVRDCGYENLLRMLHLLLASEEIVRRSESGILAVEVAWLRAAELPKLVRIEELLSGQQSPPAAPAPKGRPRPPGDGSAKNAPPASAKTEPKTAPAEEPESPASPPPAPGTTQAFLDRISRHKQALAAHLAAAQHLEYTDGELKIIAPNGDTWLRDRLSRKTNIDALERALTETWGREAGWRLKEAQEPPPKPVDETPEPNPTSSAADDPRVQAVLEIFGGSVESIRADNGKESTR